VGLDVHTRNSAVLTAQGIELVVGDARALPFSDREFDIVFCNSLLEHLPAEDRSKVASELTRVGRKFWVQTPNKYFPLEPHYMLPLVQFLPQRLRRLLDQRFCGGAIELLKRRELEALFPDAAIYREKVGPLTKSLVAYGVPAEPEET
jgi:hypothetical protein